MFKKKHNLELCSSRFVARKLARSESNKSQPKNNILGWPLLFLGIFIFLIIFALSPINFFIEVLKANYTKTDTISLYPLGLEQDKEADNFEEGWWNQNLAIGSDRLEADASLDKFNDSNSSFFTGGNYSLSFFDFEFLQEDLGDFLEVEDVNTEEAEVIIYQEDIEADLIEPLATQDDSMTSTTVDIELESNLATSSEELPAEELIDSELNASPTDDTKENNLSFVNYLDTFFKTSPSQAEELMSADIRDLEDLGVFRNARVNFSMAMLDLEKTEIVEDMSSEETFLAEEKIEAKGDTQTATTTETAIDQATSSEEKIIEIDTDISSSSQEEQAEVVLDEYEETEPESSDTFAETETIEVISEILEDESSVIVEDFIEEEEKEAEIIVEEVTEDIVIEESPVEENPQTESSKEEEAVEQKEEASVEATEVSETVSWFDFVKKVNAQSGTYQDAKLIIWYAFASSSDETDLLWRELDVISDDAISNSLNQGYFSYPADFIDSWGDIKNLKIKLEALDSSSQYIAYLDNVWLDVDYEPSELVKKINERKEWEKALELVSGNIDLRMDEEGFFKFHYQKKKDLLGQVGEFLGLSSYWENINIRTVLVDSRGQELDLALAMVFEEDGNFGVKLPEMPRGFRPGKYSIRFYIEDTSSGELETIFIDQDFSWGVLAINTNKATYSDRDDSAFLQMAVLDDTGHTLCDAELALHITSPGGYVSSLSTSNSQIIANEECGPDNVIDSPDYFAFYMIDEIGTYRYTLQATTSNGVYEISDQFEKILSQSFEVERQGPTRIYPVANYDMTINVLANEDFRGAIYDYLPNGFEIATTTLAIKKASSSEFLSYNHSLASSTTKFNFRETKSEDENKIAWENITLDRGDELIINYEFDAPNVSPEFYLLGELEIGDFVESRQWQIASDAVTVATSTNGIHVGWTSQANAWDNGTDTYASRDIPKKTDTGEPTNYIQSSVNSISNLNGDINSVEVGIEGYVEGTTVSAYIVPYFSGSTAGSQYTITGTTLGTSDDDLTDYVDITNSTNAPSTWTWSDIQNLDIRVFAGNSLANAARFFYIDQIRIRVDYTPNTAPDSEFISAKQRLDSSGVVDIAIKVSDIDNDNSQARLDYVFDADCDFSTPLDPSLDETEANATSTVGDADIDNNQTYQIGTSTGWISMLNASSTVYFDWLSESDTADTEGTYCLRLTASDQEIIDLSPATTSLTIDNKAPKAPGIISDASSTKDSIRLYYGATSSDLHFNEYRIYYATSSDVSDEDYLHASTSDINLSDVLFNSEASTTISGLLENTTYYFSVFAYDDYQHVSSSSVFSYKTNSAPSSIFTKASVATQRTDGSGIVDISIDVDDLDNHDSQVKIDYVQGASCDFSSPLDPSLDETQSNISSSFGLISINNTNEYQIGNSAGWILTPATNTIAFDWSSQIDEATANDTYCLRIMANDQIDDQNIMATTTLTLDNLAPTAPGDLIFDSISTSTLTLGFGAISVESNFLTYKIFYKEGSSGVSESDNPHLDPNLGDINFNSEASTTIENLSPNTDYVINIWVYDNFGNFNSATEVTFKTDATVSNDSLTLLNPAASNWVIADGVSEFSFEAAVSEGNGWNVLDNVVFRLADREDHSSEYSDLEFTWNQTSDTFTETGTDTNSAVSLAPSSYSSCGVITCNLYFNLVFNDTFASSSIDYAAELYTTNDSAISDYDHYTDFYQAKIIRVEQVHYRWRNDDGGE